jgi:hypothetical protein
MSRFHSTRVTVEKHFLQACRYVVLNAQRAGLCVHPRDWRWSSYPATVGLRKPPAFLKLDKLLGLFAPDRAQAMRRFAAFVADGLARPQPADP